MTYQDLFITPIIFLILFLVINNYKKKHYHNKPLEARYFQTAFLLKCFGAIALGLIYQFYYHGGDTFNYFDNSKHVYRAFFNDPGVGLQLLFGKAGNVTSENMNYTRFMYFYSDSSSYFVVRVAAFFSLLTFQTYSGVALFFAIISFTGVWSIYSVFIKEYPYLKKHIAIGCLFLPSLIFWGSGLMKDSLCLAGIGWLIYGFYSLVILRRKLFLSTLLMFLGAYILLNIKLYILLSILPALLIWLAFYFNKKITFAVRIISFPVILVLLMGIGYLLMVNLSTDNEKYSIDAIQNTSKVTSQYLRRISDEGASYSLSSSYDGSLGGTIRLAPEAILASFFRPFLWESRNIVMLMSGVENTALLILFITGLWRLWGNRVYKLKNSSLIIFCIVFSVLFAIGIGLTTFNFGALVRYKIPFLPFFATVLVVWNYKKKTIKSLLHQKKIKENRLKILTDMYEKSQSSDQ